LNGYHFMSKNPDSGLFGGPDLANTGPFQPFRESTKSSIVESSRPSGAVYSVDLGGGTPRVEAHGIHNPRGIAFNQFGTAFMTNDGMELRGTRPVADDPDSVLKIVSGWYGWPDYSADLQPITESKFQPPREMAIKGGYDGVWFLIDHAASNKGEGLIRPSRNALLGAVFPSLSGAQKMEFVPGVGPFSEYQGNAIVALCGDRAPFAIGGGKYKQLKGPVGFKVVRVDLGSHEVEDIVKNTKGLPASKITEGEGVLERPWSVKFDSKGNLYILDFGEMEVRMDGREKVKPRSGRLFILEPAQPAQTPAPATTQPHSP
jgi:hypothetical protein